jgi:hypothetical protein
LQTNQQITSWPKVNKYASTKEQRAVLAARVGGAQMIRVYGTAKVLDATTKRVNGTTVAELYCSTSNGYEYSNIKLQVPVNKHANFLKGKWLYFEGELHSNNEVWANLKDIRTIEYTRRRGTNQKTATTQTVPAEENDEIPF